MKSEFEKLPCIAEKLKHATWSEKYCQYVALNIICKEKDLHFLDGAWYAYQEQQKKIDATIGEISRALNCCESIETECVLVEIKELLK